MEFEEEDRRRREEEQRLQRELEELGIYEDTSLGNDIGSDEDNDDGEETSPGGSALRPRHRRHQARSSAKSATARRSAPQPASARSEKPSATSASVSSAQRTALQDAKLKQLQARNKSAAQKQKYFEEFEGDEDSSEEEREGSECGDANIDEEFQAAAERLPGAFRLFQSRATPEALLTRLERSTSAQHQHRQQQQLQQRQQTNPHQTSSAQRPISGKRVPSATTATSASSAGRTWAGPQAARVESARPASSLTRDKTSHPNHGSKESSAQLQSGSVTSSSQKTEQSVATSRPASSTSVHNDRPGTSRPKSSRPKASSSDTAGSGSPSSQSTDVTTAAAAATAAAASYRRQSAINREHLERIRRDSMADNAGVGRNAAHPSAGNWERHMRSASTRSKNEQGFMSLPCHDLSAVELPAGMPRVKRGDLAKTVEE